MTLIHRYSRRQAISDGVLIDVSDMAKEAGIRYPTALTRAVWERYVRVPDGVPCQDEEGRLWDILWMLRCAVSKQTRSGAGDRCDFELYVKNDEREAQRVSLYAVCGPGDHGEPVVTILLPGED